MNSSAPQPSDLRLSGGPTIIAGRFQIVRSLGRGGMAAVYEAHELGTDRQLALKRLTLLDDPLKQRRSVELFEREYFTLAQLNHPRVVGVYDYGIADGGPFYTMELLHGAGLEQTSPHPWRRASALARDIASVLSLVHARRLVYRDLNPRNVRCTLDDTAKLIDFGALCTMGESHQLVGTPAYCAPETLDQQPLDARTDLYSLGATLYFMLTGRHAYPARSFEQLRQYWAAEPPAPRTLVPEIPAALDALVMHLMHPDASVRPASAAEVAEQLLVIEGRTCEDTPQVSAAYLITPTLVGREAFLARIRRRIAHARDSRGQAVLIEGPTGVGRSRALAACLLEAQLLGALALRADASHALDEWGMIRTLAQQLLLMAAELTRRAALPDSALLYQLIPELASTSHQTAPAPAPANDVSTAAAPSDGALRANMFAAVRNWLCAIARERPLVLAIDDLHLVDEPSAAAIALLVDALAGQRLLVIASVTSDATRQPSAPVRLFKDGASVSQLLPLTLPETEQLLRSVFGDVPHLQTITHQLFEICEGIPAALLELAQALVSRGLAHHRAGVWSLPESIDRGVLPENMAQALLQRVSQLSHLALELARYITLADDRPLSFDECVTACHPHPALAVNAALSELSRAQLTTYTSGLYSLRQRAAAGPLLRQLDPLEQRRLHQKLAELFERRGNDEMRRAQHLLAAGVGLDALMVLLAESARIQPLIESNSLEFHQLTATLPAQWFECYLRCLALCHQHKTPRQARYALSGRIAGLTDVMNVPGELGYGFSRTLLTDLAQDSGLTDYLQLDRSLDNLERLKRAIGLAQARYESTPVDERGLDPITGIRQLVRATLATVGYAAKNLDWQLLEIVPSLAPFVPLSPAVGAVHLLAQGVAARTTARFMAARIAYHSVVQLTDQPGATGLGATYESYLRFGVMFGLGVIEANMGRASCLGWASRIEGEPMHRVNAQLIRLLHALWQGRGDEADRLQREIELMRLRDSARQWLEGAHLIGEAVVSAWSDDLTRIKRTCQRIEPLARQQRPWALVSAYARAEYERICGDLRSARAGLAALLSDVHAGQHQIWPAAAATHVRVLFELGALEEAVTAGERYVADAADAGLIESMNHTKLSLALAHAACGQHEPAQRLVREVLDDLRQLDASGLNVMLACETGARIALLARDWNRYEEFARQCFVCAQQPHAHTLSARYEKLKRSGQLAQHARESLRPLPMSNLGSQLAGVADPEERSRKILELLISRSGARGGALYLQNDHGLSLRARSADAEVTDSLNEQSSTFLSTQVHHEQDVTQSLQRSDGTDGNLLATPSALWVDAQGDSYRPVLLSHQCEDGFVVTGVAVLIEHKGRPLLIPGQLIAQASAAAAVSGNAKLTVID